MLNFLSHKIIVPTTAILLAHTEVCCASNELGMNLKITFKASLGKVTPHLGSDQ